MSVKKNTARGKQPHPGQKCVRGKPLYYDEVKKRVSLMLTPTVINKLDVAANNSELSRTEFLERLLRKVFKIGSSS